MSAVNDHPHTKYLRDQLWERYNGALDELTVGGLVLDIPYVGYVPIVEIMHRPTEPHHTLKARIVPFDELEEWMLEAQEELCEEDAVSLD